MEENKNLTNEVEETKTDESGATNTEVEETKTTTSESQDTDKSSDKDKQLSQDELIAQLRLDNAKLKRATDKATKEASSYKKQLREKQSVEEIEAQEKAEKEAQREEEFMALKKENAVNKLEKSFMAMGYSEEQAHKSAVAQYENDTDTLFAIQRERQEQLKNEIRAEIIANNPEINSGEGDDKESDPFADGFNSVK